MEDLLSIGLFIIGIMLLAGFFLIGRGSKTAKPDIKPVPDFANLLTSAVELETEFTKLTGTGDFEVIDQVVDNLELYPAEKQQTIIKFVIEQGIFKRYQTGLTDVDYKVRTINAERLGKIGGSGTLELLFSAMADKYEEVRMAATSALKKLSDSSIATTLVYALKDPYKWLPARIAEVLVAIGPAVVPALHDALEDNDPTFRGYVIEILGEIGDPSSAQPLNRALKDSNANVRWQAARALGKIGQSSSVRPLSGLLEDPEVKVKVQAIRSLGAIGDIEAIQYFAPYLTVEDPVIRFTLLEALHNLGPEGLRIIESALLSGKNAAAAGTHASMSSDSQEEAKVTIKYQ